MDISKSRSSIKIKIDFQDIKNIFFEKNCNATDDEIKEIMEQLFDKISEDKVKNIIKEKVFK